MPPWRFLIRFTDTDGVEHLGEPNVGSGDDVIPAFETGALKATVLETSSIFTRDVRKLGVVAVEKLLSPLRPSDVPMIKCVGLNYMKHIKEGGRTPPPYPSIFIKPSACVANWDEDVPIPEIATDNGCDYEGELCFVVGKEAKDVPEQDALSYIAGYCVGNDVSSRKWQRDPAYAGGVPQWCFSKGFDKYAPLGAVLGSPEVLGAADDLDLKTSVNGELRQDSNTSDLLFNVPKILAFITQGTTIAPGTVVMTGTPAGVGMGFQPKPKYLGHGDVVQVSIGGLGMVKNRVVFPS
ncbi:hypothetical protein MMC08_005525 [Hypocenomyce scalaris]|nr:hypothetical protein [Hypocenomyce scalaris]